MDNPEHLAQLALQGERRALARLLSLVEDGAPAGQRALATLFPHAGQAHVVGITGATGAGKSTLVNRLAHAFRERDLRLAVVAVDPTSPFSGGALLGDRLRMRDLVTDPGIFIRSMASRGHPGGIAHATRDVVTVLDAVGMPLILVETVGAGQAQVEVAQVAHTVVLVEAPGMGDEIQALKAGLLEIADLIVVNKADRPGARQAVRALQNVRPATGGHHGAGAPDASTAEEAEGWEAPILQTSALEGQGIDALLDAILAHRRYLEESGTWRALRRRHARAEVETWLGRHLRALIDEHVEAAQIEAAVGRVLRRAQDPATAARDVLDTVTAALRRQDLEAG